MIPEMKTTRRRNMATLTFIAFLAAVYAVILLVGRPGGRNNAPAGMEDTMEAAGSRPKASIASPDTVVQSENVAPKKKKKSKKTVKSTKSGSHTAPDNPDVFDRPVTPVTPAVP